MRVFFGTLLVLVTVISSAFASNPKNHNLLIEPPKINIGDDLFTVKKPALPKHPRLVVIVDDHDLQRFYHSQLIKNIFGKENVQVAMGPKEITKNTDLKIVFEKVKTIIALSSDYIALVSLMNGSQAIEFALLAGQLEQLPGDVVFLLDANMPMEGDEIQKGCGIQVVETLRAEMDLISIQPTLIANSSDNEMNRLMRASGADIKVSKKEQKNNPVGDASEERSLDLSSAVKKLKIDQSKLSPSLKLKAAIERARLLRFNSIYPGTPLRNSGSSGLGVSAH